MFRLGVSVRYGDLILYGMVKRLQHRTSSDEKQLLDRSQRDQKELIVNTKGYLVFEACSVLLGPRIPGTKLDFEHSPTRLYFVLCEAH